MATDLENEARPYINLTGNFILYASMRMFDQVASDNRAQFERSLFDQGCTQEKIASSMEEFDRLLADSRRNCLVRLGGVPDDATFQ